MKQLLNKQKNQTFQNMKIKLPPQNKDAENAVIGACFVEPDKFAEIYAWIKDPEIFYYEDNKAIFKAMIELRENYMPIDAILVAAKLKNVQSDDKWSWVIWEKAKSVISSAHTQFWCMLIIESYIKRKSEASIYDLQKTDDPLMVAQQLDEALKKALSFKSTTDWSDMSQIMVELYKRREEIENGKEYGLLTGFRELDLITGGLQTGFHVIGARPSVGKTAFATSLALNIAEAGNAIGIISLEMPNVQLASRIASMKSNVEFWRIFRNKHQTDQEKEFVNQSISDLSTLPIFISDKAGVTGLDIRLKAEKLVKTQNAKCIIIDYLQLVDSSTTNKNDNRQNEVQKLSRSLKLLSNDLDIPIIALAQVNRESETSDKVNKVPKLSQLRESGAIEQDVDMGMIIDRPFKRGQTTNENGESTEFEADLIVEKHRNGETRTINLEFEPSTMRFRDKNYSKHTQWIT